MYNMFNKPLPFICFCLMSISCEADNIPEDKTSPSPISEKTVAWYGTSIPAGFPHHDQPAKWSYADKAVAKLGGIIQNRCVSGSTLMFKPQVEHFDNLPFTDEHFEHGYKKQMLDLIGTSLEPDLFVLDFGANDGQFDKKYFKMLDLNNLNWEERTTNTFLGAYNLVITSLLKKKPNANIALLTHYSDDADEPNFFPNTIAGYKKMNDLIVAIGHHYQIPVCEMRGETGWTVANLRRTWCKDGIHPASGDNMHSVEVLTEIVCRFIQGLSLRE